MKTSLVPRVHVALSSGTGPMSLTKTIAASGNQIAWRHSCSKKPQTFDRDGDLSDDRVNIVMFESYEQTIVRTTRPSLYPVVLSATVALQLFRTPNLIGPLWVETLLFSGSVSLISLFVYCFPNQSHEVFRELQGRSSRKLYRQYEFLNKGKKEREREREREGGFSFVNSSI